MSSHSLLHAETDYYRARGYDFIVGLFDPAHRPFRQQCRLTMETERQFCVLTWARGEQETFQLACDYFIRFYRERMLRRNHNTHFRPQA